MPVNYSKYPKNWKTEIRPNILQRANNCCENCGIENYAIGWRSIDGSFIYADDYLACKKNKGGFVMHTGRTKIVLTISHTDHNINNNSPENLKALCQKCHLSHDAKFHAENRKKNLELKKGFIPLFS